MFMKETRRKSNFQCVHIMVSLTEHKTFFSYLELMSKVFYIWLDMEKLASEERVFMFSSLTEDRQHQVLG